MPYRCRDCREHFSVRTGTVLAESHLPLHKWLVAIYMFTTARKGIPSTQLARELNLAGFKLPCYVTEDGQRVISARRMQAVLHIVDEKKAYPAPGTRLESFLNNRTLKPLFQQGFKQVHFKAIICKHGQTKINGYGAEVLADICSLMLKARRMGLLSSSRQKIVADQCEILIEAFARVGIIALVDEATGYQEVRDKKALEAILDKYLSKEFSAWAKRFPDEFYKEIFRLNDWQWKDISKRPGVVGKYTNDIVYDRLAPNIREELERLNPKNKKGSRQNKHHQWLTNDIGHTALSQHLHAVIALMKASTNWKDFKKLIRKSFPKKGDQRELFED
jgi:hypothetical protein